MGRESGMRARQSTLIPTHPHAVGRGSQDDEHLLAWSMSAAKAPDSRSTGTRTAAGNSILRSIASTVLRSWDAPHVDIGAMKAKGHDFDEAHDVHLRLQVSSSPSGRRSAFLKELWMSRVF